MSDGTKKGGLGGFGDDDDLLKELDAWDATFDALHESDKPSQAAADADPTRVGVSAVPADPHPGLADDGGATIEAELDPSGEIVGAAGEDGTTVDLDVHTLDRGLPTSRPVAPARPGVRTAVADDFDLAAPEALGELLGASPLMPSAAPSAPVDDNAATSVRVRVPLGLTGLGANPFDDDVFTSASRPAVAPRDGGRDADDDLAPPPAPAAPADAAPAGRRSRSATASGDFATESPTKMTTLDPGLVDRSRRAAEVAPAAAPAPARTTPAIVRRPDPRADRSTPAGGIPALVEATAAPSAAASAAAQSAASAAAFFAEEPPATEFTLDEAFYDDIEVQAGAATAPAPIEPPRRSSITTPPPSAPEPRRTTVHVVRRTAATTKPPPLAAELEAGPVIEMEADDEPAVADAAPALNFDDFSDLAPPPASTAAPAPVELVDPRAPVADLDQDSDAAEIKAMPGFEDSTEIGPDGIDDEFAVLGPAGNQRPRRPSGGATRVEPLAGRPASGPAGSGAVPTPASAGALLSARVKTPTSVPPMGQPLEALVAAASPDPVAPAPSPAVVAPSATIDAARELPDPVLDLDAIALPEQGPVGPVETDDAVADRLMIYERELEAVDDTHTAAALRAEAGRLAERLGDPDRARGHFEAALIANPRCLPALHGLRRVARAVGDLAEVTTHLDTELGLAGSLERRPLALARVDMLMAAAEQDLARVAVGELLDGAPSDVRGLLAHLELAFLDGRADEFADALDRLGAALPDSPLRASVAVARGHLAERRGDRAAAAACFQQGASAGAVAWLGSVRTEPSPHRPLLTLAGAAAATPPLAGGFAVRAERHGADPAQRAAALAAAAVPSDPTIATLAARLAGDSNSIDGMAAAFGQLAAIDARPALRAHAAAIAAELSGGSAAAWELAAAADPDDEYAAAQRRSALLAEGQGERSLALDVAAIGADRTRTRAVVRAAYGMAATGDVDAALALLAPPAEDEAERRLGVGDATVEARADILAAAGRWQARADLWTEVASGADDAVAGLALARAARATHDAVIELESGADAGTVIVAALEAWGRVLDRDVEDAEAHAACQTLADGLGDGDVTLDVLGRALAVERNPARARALARARVRAAIAAPTPDVARVDELLEELTSLPGGADDPRRLALAAEWAGRTRRPHVLAAALTERAEALAARPERAVEVVAQRYRAAALWLVADEAARAVTLLGRVVEAQPSLAVAHDLATTARRRLGDLDEVAARGAAPTSTAGPDAFARLVRDAELAAARGDGSAASVLLGKALTLRPQDPIAEQPLLRVARHGREAAAVASIALAELRTAEARADQRAVAEAYERLGDVDAELRADLGSAVVSWEAALAADPHRLAAIRALERAHLTGPDPRWAELARLRGLEAGAVAARAPAPQGDLVALGLDRAGLSERAGLPDPDLRAQYQAVIEREPGQRVALFHLESLVRRGGASRELAALERAIAELHASDPGASAAFLTRAGETLTEVGDLDAAIAAFKDAVARAPAHVPALAGWRWAALRGQLWVDVAEAALAEAAQQASPAASARLAHLAAVSLMDRALDGDRALAALRVALAAEPAHRDAFVRTRILLEEDANHDDLASLLSQRLDVETDVGQRVALHRAVAELHRNFLSDRDTAKRHYQAILEIDPNDVRAIAAVSDICWEQGAWAEAAEALMARAKLEREPALLRTLFFRLGLIYADRIPDPGIAIKAFQKALSYNPDDDAALDRLAELAIASGEWKLALGACERLIKIETDPDRRVRHLHRVARVFADGLGDRRRAERALNVALDGAPTNDQALTALIRFYQDVRDVTSIRVHLNRVAGMMRARLAADVRDGAAARVLSRVMVARAEAGVTGSAQLARAAAELAVITGGAEDRERSILTSQPAASVAGLTRPEHAELLYPRTVPAELRQIFAQLGDRLAKHVGVDLRPYGATRGDRLRAKDSPVAAAAAQVGEGLGVGEVDVYLSPRQPWVLIAEPTSPPSLVIGAELAKLGASAVRFAAGGALVLARASLSIPLRLPPDELAVLVVAMARLFQPDFPSRGAADDAVATQVQKLRRLIPSGLMNDLRPYALALDGGSLEVPALAAGLRAAAYRAGLVASGSLASGLAAIAGQAGITGGPAAALGHPDAVDLIQFALGEDHAALVG